MIFRTIMGVWIPSTLQGTNISPKTWAFWRWFSKLPKVGYVNSLEGTLNYDVCRTWVQPLSQQDGEVTTRISNKNQLLGQPKALISQKKTKDDWLENLPWVKIYFLLNKQNSSDRKHELWTPPKGSWEREHPPKFQGADRGWGSIIILVRCHHVMLVFKGCYPFFHVHPLEDANFLLGCPWYLVTRLFHPNISRLDTSPK